jgi:hypothetical protein
MSERFSKVYKFSFYQLFSLSIFYIIVFNSTAFAIYTKKETDQSTQFIVVPGMRECECKKKCRDREKSEGEGAVKHSLINPASLAQLAVASDPPILLTDIGQKRCVSHLEKSIESYLQSDEIENIVLYSQCQGTATALNYVSEHPEKIKALILEGAVGSGNRVVHWRAKNILPKVGSMPLAEWYLPYVAKCIGLFCYSPDGDQPILSLAEIPTDLLVVIIHAKNDNMTPYTDALGLYYGLRQAGNENVFLIVTDGGHINLLNRDRDVEKLAALNQIYKMHGLPYDKDLLSSSGEISEHELREKYQPDYESLQSNYEELVSNTQTHQTLGSVLKWGCASILAAVVGGLYYCF